MVGCQRLRGAIVSALLPIIEWRPSEPGRFSLYVNGAPEGAIEVGPRPGWHFTCCKWNDAATARDAAIDLLMALELPADHLPPDIDKGFTLSESERSDLRALTGQEWGRL